MYDLLNFLRMTKSSQPSSQTSQSQPSPTSLSPPSSQQNSTSPNTPLTCLAKSVLTKYPSMSDLTKFSFTNPAAESDLFQHSTYPDKSFLIRFSINPNEPDLTRTSIKPNKSDLTQHSSKSNSSTSQVWPHQILHQPNKSDLAKYITNQANLTQCSTNPCLPWGLHAVHQQLQYLQHYPVKLKTRSWPNMTTTQTSEIPQLSTPTSTSSLWDPEKAWNDKETI